MCPLKHYTKNYHVATTYIIESTEIKEDGECTPSCKVPRYSFPYLDLSGINEVEREALEAKLCDDFDNMTEEFQVLKNTIKQSMKARNITVMEVVDCVSEFKTLEPVYKDLRKTPKFRHQFPELLKMSSLDEAMIVISDYSSFFNYRLVEQIIKSLGTNKDKESLAKYEQKFEEYAKCSVYQCPPEIGYASENNWPSFHVKVHQEGFEECSNSHLRRFINKIANILNLPLGVLLLKSVYPGCLELTLQVPLSIYQDLFPLSPQQEVALVTLGVIKISAGDYQYPSNRDEGDDSDRRDDPEPDDGAGGGDLQHSHSVQDDVDDNGKESSDKHGDRARDVRHSTSSGNLSDSDKSTDQLDDSAPPSEYQFLSLQEEARQGQTDDTPNDKGSDSGIGTRSSTTTIAELLECRKV